MANPFDQFDQRQPNPFDRFDAPPKERSIMGVLTGSDGGERYQTWPERLARGVASGVASAVTLPGDVITGKTPVRDAEGNLTDEVIGRSAELAAVASPVSPAARARPGMLRSAGRTKPLSAPSAEQLKAVASRDFEAFRKSGLEIDPAYVRDWAYRVTEELREAGLGPEVAKRTNKILARLQNPPRGAVSTSQDIHALRRTLGELGGNFTRPSEAHAADVIRRSLDGFISGLPDDAIVAGSPRAVKPFKDALGNYAASKRSDRITGVEDAAELRASAANSGQNVGNTIRQRIASLLLDQKKSRGFTPDEIRMLEDIVKGSPGANLTRRLGNFLGGGGGLGALVTTGAGAGAGAAIGGLVGGTPGATAGAAIGGMALPAAGATMKSASNALTKGALRAADEVIRRRSPLYENGLAALAPATPDAYRDILRALILSGPTPATGQSNLSDLALPIPQR